MTAMTMILHRIRLRHPPGLAPPLRAALRRVGAPAIVALGFVGVLCWAFVGSLVFGLGTPGAAGAATAWRWLAGEGCIAATAGAAALLAAGNPGERGGR